MYVGKIAPSLDDEVVMALLKVTTGLGWWLARAGGWAGLLTSVLLLLTLVLGIGLCWAGGPLVLGILTFHI